MFALRGMVITDQDCKKRTMEEIVMTTRRNFLKAGTAAVATGIVFCSCGLLQGAHAQQPVTPETPRHGRRKTGQNH